MNMFLEVEKEILSSSPVPEVIEPEVISVHFHEETNTLCGVISILPNTTLNVLEEYACLVYVVSGKGNLLREEKDLHYVELIDAEGYFYLKPNVLYKLNSGREGMVLEVTLFNFCRN